MLGPAAVDALATVARILASARELKKWPAAQCIQFITRLYIRKIFIMSH